MDRLKVMKEKENNLYAHSHFLKTRQNAARKSLLVNSVLWREMICTWAYNVSDHFNLSRSIVAVSMNLYDRYLTTCGNKCEGRFALLCSLSTFYIAIKLHVPKSILARCNMPELSKLSRGQCHAKDIEDMERKILEALSWLVNPPLASDFIPLILNLLPPIVHPFVCQNMFELSQYLVELTVCDPFFIDSLPSVIAFAALLNVLEEDIDYLSFSLTNRAMFLQEVQHILSLNKSDLEVQRHRSRMRKLLSLQEEPIEVKEQHSSPSSVRYFDNIVDLQQLKLPNQEQHRSLRSHRRSRTSDSVDFYKVNVLRAKGTHRRISSLNAISF